MKSVSELLQYYLTVKSINISDAARACGIDRANMHKIFYGKRKLSSPEIAAKLAAYLKLSPKEDADFREAYYYSLEGYDIYRKRRVVNEFFMNLENSLPFKRVALPRIGFDGRNEEVIPDVSAITSFQDVHYTAIWVIMKELAKPQPQIRIISAAENEDLLVTVLKSCLIENEKAAVQHAFRMRGRFFEENGENDNYNFSFLTAVFTLCMGTENYQPYYYYVSEEATLKEPLLSMYSYLIATSEHVLECSQDYQHALLINDHAVVESEAGRFDASIKNMKPLIKISRNLQELMDSVHNYTNENTQIYDIDMEPCIVRLITEDILKRNVKQMDSRLTRYLSTDVIDFTDRVISFVISEDGIRRFLNSGRLSVMPDDLYTPLSMEDRIFLVRMYIQKLADRTVLLYHDLYDPEKIVSFFVGDKSCVLYYRVNETQIYNFCIGEDSICSVFRSYIANLPKNKYYPPEQTADRMLEILEEYI